MIAAWTIGIALVTKSNFGLISSQMADQSAKLDSKISGVNGNLAKMPGAAKLAGQALDALAVVAAATFKIGVQGASDMQVAIANVAVSTGQTTERVAQQYTSMALAISNATGVLSMADGMKTVQTLSTFVPDPKRLHDAAFVTEVAKYADVQKLSGHEPDLQKSVSTLGQVSHMLGAYSPAEVAKVAEMLDRASFSVSGGNEKLVTQLGYFAETYKRAGVSNDQILNLGVLGSLSLGHGKWGNAYDTLLKNLVSPTKPQSKAQEALGIRRSDGTLDPELLDVHGNIDFIKFFRQVNRATKNMSGTDAIQAISPGFNQTARRIISVASSDKMMTPGTGFYDQTRRAMARRPDIDHAQATLVHTLPGETARLTTAFQSLATIIMGPMTQHLTSFIGKLADATQGLANYAHDHPRQADAAGWGVTALTAWGAYGLFKKGLGFFSKEAADGLHQFEIKVVVSFTELLSNIGVKVLTQIGKLGTIGAKLSNFVLDIAADMTTLADVLSKFVGVIGKIGGGILGVATTVLTPTDDPDGFIKWVTGQGPATNRGGAGLGDDPAWLRYNKMHYSPPAPAIPARGGHAHSMKAQHHHHYHYHAAEGEDDATSRRRALQHGRKVASVVADVVASAGRTLTRSAGSTISSSRMSHFETVGGAA